MSAAGVEVSETTAGLLLRGGTIVDGTGARRYRADVRVRRGCITEIGRDLRLDDEQVIDAGDAIVAPGFIDSHTHLDPPVFWDRLCDPLPQHGVTTAVMGNCSLALAPVRPTDRDEIMSVFAYIEDMPPDALTATIPWTWTTWPEYARELGRDRYGLNLAALVGHTPLRQFVMGAQAWERPAAPREREDIANVLAASLAAGAVGLSTSLFDSDARKRPVPSTLADDAEFAALLQVLARHKAILTFIPDVARHATLLKDVDRMAQLCRHHGVTASWNGLFHDERKPERSAEILVQAQALQANGARVFPQVSPRRMDIRINWAGGMAFYSMPPWHTIIQASAAQKAEMLRDAAWRDLARQAWDALPRTLLRHRELDRIRLVSVTRVENEQWLGRTLADLVAARGGHPSDVLADWVLGNDLDPGVVGTGVQNADPGGVAGLITHPATIISNSDAGAHVQMMCGAGDTTLLLSRHVRERGDLTLEQAIWALTARQAEMYAIPNRGRIKVGLAADLVVFDLAAVEWAEETLVYDLPGGAARLRRPPGGFAFTIVGGVTVQQAGELTGASPGKLLAHANVAPHWT